MGRLAFYFGVHQLCVMNREVGKTIAQHVGNLGEKMAAEWLWLKGFDIVEQNCRVGRYEIDLVCKDRSEWVMVEVKTRRDGHCLLPESAVDHKKRISLQKAAQGYMKQKGVKTIPRLDVVAVSLLPHGAQMMYFQGK